MAEMESTQAEVKCDVSLQKAGLGVCGGWGLTRQCQTFPHNGTTACRHLSPDKYKLPLTKPHAPINEVINQQILLNAQF